MKRILSMRSKRSPRQFPYNNIKSLDPPELDTPVFCGLCKKQVFRPCDQPECATGRLFDKIKEGRIPYQPDQ